ncbi:hypothetical protein FALBO_16052 [Fusarium albosuccineum]|uniref:Uncharacterized protein n=1 Tax=Fusarium albosuccineum TaxID=1237068 RepID=A0A8H4KPD7_9HYPO|nr:hypothetical protein FALBO_16052 [Fusarium albosuccineum]
MATRDEQASFQCHICQRGFVRQEHLTRHVRTHTREKPYSCSQCDKSFSRQDVLIRHETSHAPNSVHSNVVSSRACKECAIGRVRCTKESTCRRCRSRNLECVYPPVGKRKAASVVRLGSVAADSRSSSPSENSEQEGLDDLAPQQHVDMGVATDGGQPIDAIDPRDSRMSERPRRASPNRLQDTAAWDPMVLSTNEIHPQNNSGFAASNMYQGLLNTGIGEPLMGLSTMNWLSPQYQDTVIWDNQLAGVPFELGSMAFAFAPDVVDPNLASGWQLDRGPNPSAVLPGPVLSDNHEVAVEECTIPAPSTSIPESSTSRSSEGTLYVEGAAARAPFRGRRSHKYSNTDALSTSSPVDGPEHLMEISTSPNAEMVDDHSHTFVSELAYNTLCQKVRDEAHLHSSNLDLTCIPPLGYVRCFIRLYYRNFHPTYPFLRRDIPILPQPDSWVVLLALSAIGAKYLGGPWPLSISTLLDKILNIRLAATQYGNTDAWVPGHVHDSQTELSLTTVQAMILNLICMLHSGLKNMVENSLNQRHHLVDQCRRMNLLSHLTPRTNSATADEADVNLEDWAAEQAEIRTGYMIWLLDSMISYAFGCKPSFQLHEITSPLPCPDEIWETPTIERISDKSFQTETMLEALDLLYMEKQQPKNLGEFGNILLVYAVCRRTNEALYQHQTALSRWVPTAGSQPRSRSNPLAETWPPALPILTRWRNSACDCLDILHWTANSTAAKAGGWEHPTILHLHLSRLLLLTPWQHVQKVAAMSSPVAQNKRSNNKIYLEACNHLRQWAILDQYKARLSMVHAGALLWHVRRYSSNGFMEPYAVYLATLAVWSYSVFVRPQTTAPEQPTTTPRSAEANSWPHLSPPSTNTGMAESNVDEEPEPSFVHLDRPCDDEMVQVYVRLGHKMKGYMLRVGDICSPDAPPKILKEGVRMLSQARGQDGRFTKPDNTRDFKCTWGIERSFVQSLTCLLQATTTQSSDESGPAV